MPLEISIRIEVITAVSRGFHCDSTAFELNGSINHDKITVLNMSIYTSVKLVWYSYCILLCSWPPPIPP